jgi:hypothetical protein
MGFYGNCAVNINMGECTDKKIICKANEFWSEQGMCVPKPWYDFTSCEQEKTQGACSDGNDPNEWVALHCSITCAA